MLDVGIVYRYVDFLYLILCVVFIYWVFYLFKWLCVSFFFLLYLVSYFCCGVYYDEGMECYFILIEMLCVYVNEGKKMVGFFV